MKSELKKSDTIILFGYGGKDIHLNKILYQLKNYEKKSIKIIEYGNINIIDAYNTRVTAEHFEKSEEEIKKICADEKHDKCEEITKFYREIDTQSIEDDDFLEFLYNSEEFKLKKEFWEGQLKSSINDEDLIIMSNILDFDDWKFQN